MLAAKNRVPREPKKTNTVAMCVGTRSSYTASKHGARVGVLSMTCETTPTIGFEFRRKQDVKKAKV